MLLGAHPDGLNLAAPLANLGKAVPNVCPGRFCTEAGILLHVTRGKPLDRAIALLSKGKNFSGFDIQDERSGALCTAINTKAKHAGTGLETRRI